MGNASGMHWDIGGISVDVVRDGYFSLDGGTMFGVVPKALWGKVCPPDEDNRITLTCNCLLVRTGDRIILVDTGLGDKLDEKKRRIYAREGLSFLLDGLELLGVSPYDVDTVILTHLHFDHAGGCTTRAGSGLQPVFPNARHIIQRGEWDDSLSDPTAPAAYPRENLDPLLSEGLVDFVDGDARIAEGVSVVVTGGHTRYHQGVIVESDGERLYVLGDLCPISQHVHLSYISAYDRFPSETYRAKERLLARAADEGALVHFMHDPRVPVAGIRPAEGGFELAA